MIILKHTRLALITEEEKLVSVGQEDRIMYLQSPNKMSLIFMKKRKLSSQVLRINAIVTSVSHFQHLSQWRECLIHCIFDA